MSRGDADRPMRADADKIRRAARWLTAIKRIDADEAELLDTLADRLSEALKSRAIIHIRAVNRGRRPVIPGRLDDRVTMEEMDAVARMWREGVRITEMADRLGRNPATIGTVVGRLGLYGTRQRPDPVYRALCPSDALVTPMGRVHRVMHERRRRALREREEVEA